MVYVTTAPSKLMTTRCSLDLISENRPGRVHDVDDICIDPPCKVREGLYIGSLEAEKCLNALRTARVTHVLQVGGELKPSHPEAFTYKRLVVGDDEKEDLIGCFSQAFEFIDMALKSGCVFVHCALGMSRSATVVIGYLMWKEKLPYTQALASVQQSRSVVEPNPGFALQLQEFEQNGCKLDDWAGWGEESLERAFRRTSPSGRKVVHSYYEIIRHFHVHSLTDDDMVYDPNNDTVLDL